MLWYNQPSNAYYNNYLYYSCFRHDKNVKVGKFSKNFNQSKSIFSYSKLDDHGAPSIWVIQNGKLYLFILGILQKCIFQKENNIDE